ncbi:hypothetical protein GGI04_003492 [Coemansia thaxteri]|uniref:Zn(2)-C6 fungal-type domain-containing protein n=1 Tax=Coemansia thaxteri TaxID=2663907 RepID=A0A9W8BGB0_9FUNG|nr:hypothetical protein GGI04_003492 [Coemansia thaxteri]KAJ2002269.1 hypothetical protein H4R26_003695 [Coemansia thaxteri]KAJ2457485.1 hypothetical protein GGI02_006128 [Coemansia sp. RSA 2322]KAJ2477803.1 hypothetical protein EV174_004497 [Coemansia sp. RSA 2320]
MALEQQRAVVRHLSPSPSSSDGTGVGEGSMAKRAQVKNACVHCQRACKKCDSGRPCQRCVRYNLADTCVDSKRKPRMRGIKRGPYKKRKKDTTTDSGSGSTTTTVPAPPARALRARPPVLGPGAVAILHPDPPHHECGGGSSSDTPLARLPPPPRPRQPPPATPTAGLSAAFSSLPAPFRLPPIESFDRPRPPPTQEPPPMSLLPPPLNRLPRPPSDIRQSSEPRLRPPPTAEDNDHSARRYCGSTNESDSHSSCQSATPDYIAATSVRLRRLERRLQHTHIDHDMTPE